MNKATIKERLDYLRGEIQAERISYGEIAELQSLAKHISPDDIELIQWAGVSENETAEKYGFDDMTETVWQWLEAYPEEMREAKRLVTGSRDMKEAREALEEMFEEGFYLSLKPLKGTLYADVLSVGYYSIGWDWLVLALKEEI